VKARLAAIDLDGTLLRTDRTVSRRTRSALAAARDAGITIVVVTARSPRSARDIAADAGIGGIAICANGATVYDLDDDRIVRHEPLPAASGMHTDACLAHFACTHSSTVPQTSFSHPA